MNMFARAQQQSGSPFKKQSKNPNFVEIKAGKCHRTGKTVTSEPEKGLLFMCVKDKLMCLCWKNRKTNKADDDMFIMGESDPVSFTRIKGTKNPDDRVYLLHFKSSDRKLFYWLQDADQSKDRELVKKINYLLNRSQPPNESEDPFIGFVADEDEKNETTIKSNSKTNTRRSDRLDGQMDVDEGQEDDDVEMKANEDENAVPSDSLLNKDKDNSTGGSICKSTSGNINNNNSTNQISHQQNEMLKKLVAGLHLPSSSNPFSNSDQISMTDIAIANEVTNQIFEDDAVIRKLKEYLPECVYPNKYSILQMMKSPQYMQALNRLDYALKSGSVNANTFGIPADFSSGKMGVEAFLLALIDEMKMKKL